MPKYVKKPIAVEARQWFKNGDHPGMVVPYQLPPRRAHQAECRVCGQDLSKHGWIEMLEGGHIVCPGDWIIAGVRGERYPCKPEIFAATYDLAESREAEASGGEVGCATCDDLRQVILAAVREIERGEPDDARVMLEAAAAAPAVREVDLE